MGAAAHYLEPATATDILQRLEAELSATIPQTAKQYEHTHIYQHPSTSQDTLEAGCYSRLSSCHPQTIPAAATDHSYTHFLPPET